MKLLVKQIGYISTVEHENSLFGCLKWWITKRNKECHSFCPSCKWYFRCQEDVAFDEYLEG